MNRPSPLIGFMAGQGQIPDDFDRMYQEEIIALFEGSDDGYTRADAREELKRAENSPINSD